MIYPVEIIVLRTALEDVKLFSKLRADLFNYPICKELYEIIANYHLKEGKLPSVELLYALAAKHSRPELNLVEGVDALRQSQPRVAEFDQFLAELEKETIRRKLLFEMREITQTLNEGKLEDAIKRLSSLSLRIEEEAEERDIAIGSRCNCPIEEEAMVDAFIPTGFEELDKIIQGFTPQEFIVCAAVRGSGKSVFLMNLGYHAFLYGKNVCYFSLEMSKEEWFRRFLALVSQVSHEKIRTSTITHEERDRCRLSFVLTYFKEQHHPEIIKVYEKNRSKLNGLSYQKLVQAFVKKFPDYVRPNYYILRDVSSPRITDIYHTLLMLKEQHGIDMVLIDYLNLIRYINDKLAMWERLLEISNTLKAIAKKLNVVVVALAQFNPQEQDTKYSRGIGEAADAVFAWELKDSDLISKIKVFDFYTIKTRHIPDIYNLDLVINFNYMKAELRRSLSRVEIIDEG